jgi:hypothetical protein
VSIPVASKIAQLLRRYPVVTFVLLVVFSMIAAKCGHPHRGLWDGPI